MQSTIDQLKILLDDGNIGLFKRVFLTCTLPVHFFKSLYFIFKSTNSVKLVRTSNELAYHLKKQKN